MNHPDTGESILPRTAVPGGARKSGRSAPHRVLGQHVTRGQLIAYSGSTGDSTGPHVHFELRRDGVAFDPVPYLRARGLNLLAGG
jgi:hypothetical protein